MKTIVMCFGMLLVSVGQMPLVVSLDGNIHDTMLNFILMTNYAFCNLTSNGIANIKTCPVVPVNISSDVHSSYSLDMLPVSPPDEPSSECCEKCYCSENCRARENCCPGPTTLLSLKEQHFHCTYAQLKPYNANKYQNAFSTLMFYGCSSDYIGNDQVRLLCENMEDYNTLDTIIPATDRRTGIIYRNGYCALCNGVYEDQLEYWTPEILCSYKYFLITDTNNIIADIRKADACNLIYNTPQGYYAESGCTVVISQCNITGLWGEYDPIIESACKAYNHIYHKGYRNVFCYMCNTNETTVDEQTCSENSDFGNYPITIVATSFSAILKFTPPRMSMEFILPTLINSYTCRKDQIYDEIQAICRNITCYPPREYVDGACVSIAETTAGLQYDVYIELSLVTEFDKMKSVALVASYLKSHFYSLMVDLLPDGVSVFGSILKQVTNGAETYDQIAMTKLFLVKIEIVIATYHLFNTSIVDKILTLDNDILKIECFGEIKGEYKMSLVKPSVTEETIVLLDSDKNDSYVEVLKFQRDRFIVVTSTLKETIIPPIACPLVSIPSDEIEEHIWGVYVHWLHIALSPSQYIYKHFQGENNTAIYICTSRFSDAMKVITQISQNKNDTSLGITKEGITPQSLLSLIFTSLSVIFSLLTILTYALFGELRTQPGVNNMMLTSHLICAQVLLQFGINQADNIPDWACKVVGILVHFAWLVTLAWMNICSFHMFRVFRSFNKRQNNDNIVRTTLKYTLYCIIVGVVPVVVHIVNSVVSSQSETIGYGGHICYISHFRMVGLVFALPAGIIVIVNFVLFAAVIASIRSLPEVEEVSRNRHFICIYLKLSTLCGLTWTFGFLFVLTDLVVLEYMFIVLNAGQGVLIFISFVCNKRVFSLYRRLGGKGKTSLSEHTRTTKTTSQF